MSQALHVGLQDRSNGVCATHLRECVLDFRSTNVDEESRLDTNVLLCNAVDETVLEERLGNCDEDGATEGLEELDASCTDGDPFLGQDGLHDKDTSLETGTNSKTSQNLVAEPFSERGVDVEGGDHAGTNGEEGHAGDDDGAVVANGTDDTT